MARESVVTYAFIVEVYHPDFPENPKKNGRRVIEQHVISVGAELNDEVRMQAKRTACSYASRILKVFAYPDDVNCTATCIRTERRINGRKESSVVKAKRVRQSKPMTAKAAPPPIPTPKVSGRRKKNPEAGPPQTRFGF